MSLTKLSLGGDGKTANPFLQCIVLKSFCRAKCRCATRTSHSIQRKSVRARPNHAATLLIYVSLPAHFCHYNLRQRSIKNDQPLHMIIFFCAAATKTTLFFMVHKNRGETAKTVSWPWDQTDSKTSKTTNVGPGSPGFDPSILLYTVESEWRQIKQC